MTAPQIPGFPGFPGFPAAAPSAPATPPAAPVMPGFPGFPVTVPTPPTAPAMAMSAVAPAFAAAPSAPVRSRYAGQALPGARYPKPQAGYQYDLRIARTEKVGTPGSAQTFVVEFETVQSDNPNEAPGTRHGYPISLMYDSGYGIVLSLVLSALGCKTEAEAASKGIGNLEGICTACETQTEMLAGRVVRAVAYERPRGKGSAKPGQIDTHLSFMPIQ